MNNILVRNILIRKQIEEIVDECSRYNIKLVLLKGVALIELFPEYTFDREIEDIDVLIKESDYKRFVSLLEKLGYRRVPYDPYAMFHPEKVAYVDISPGIWYLSKKDNVKLINSAVHLKEFGSSLNCYVLPLKEMLNYIYLHTYIHHAEKEHKWEKDIFILSKKMNSQLPIEHLHFPFLSFQKIPYKGYILRFLILPVGLKLRYIFSVLFPSLKFMFGRYNIKCKILPFGILKIAFLYFYRWCEIGIKMYKFFNKFLTNLFLKKVLVRN